MFFYSKIFTRNFTIFIYLFIVRTLHIIPYPIRRTYLGLTGACIIACYTIPVVGIPQSVSTIDIAPGKVMIVSSGSRRGHWRFRCGSGSFATSSCCRLSFHWLSSELFLSRLQLLVKNTAPFTAVGCYLFPAQCVDVLGCHVRGVSKTPGCCLNHLAFCFQSNLHG